MIEGIPDGWELVRIGKPFINERYISLSGKVTNCVCIPSGEAYAIARKIRKIEKPKQYRPFANAAEFEPFRDRWWKKTIGDDRIYPPCYYNDSYSGGLHFDRCFIDRVFDDGTPFGVEVTE